jgi:hypothetical protein
MANLFNGMDNDWLLKTTLSWKPNEFYRTEKFPKFIEGILEARQTNPLQIVQYVPLPFTHVHSHDHFWQPHLIHGLQVDLKYQYSTHSTASKTFLHGPSSS